MQNQKSNLYIVGTVHIDPDGPKRLDSLLTSLSPQTILLESHEDSLPYLKKSKAPEHSKEEIYQAFRDIGIGLNERQVQTYLKVIKKLTRTMGFELYRPQEYARKNPRTELVCMDMPVIQSEEDCKALNTTLLKRNLEALRNLEVRDLFLSKLDKGPNAYLALLRESVASFYSLDFLEQLEEMQKLRQTAQDLMQDQETEEDSDYTPEERALAKRIIDPKRNNKMESTIRSVYLADPSKTTLAICGMDHFLVLRRKLKRLKPNIKTLEEISAST